jgi:hypothetical protein
MFKVFHLDVVKVDLRCCICSNDNMLQAYVLSVFKRTPSVPNYKSL